MNKKKLSIVLLFLFIVLLPFKAFAYDENEVDFLISHIKSFNVENIRCFDFTEPRLINESQRTILLKKANDISKKYNINVMAFVVDSTYIYDATTFADDLLDIVIDKAKSSNIDLEDSILLLISNGDRRYAISTTGRAITIFNSKNLKALEDASLEYMSKKDYFTAFEMYMNQCASILDFNQKPKIVRAFYPSINKLFISLVIGFIFALLIVLYEKSKLNTVRFEKAAHEYEQNRNIRNSRDVFLYRSFIRTKKPENTSGGSGGIHTSSGGRSHGGSSGSF